MIENILSVIRLSESEVNPQLMAEYQQIESLLAMETTIKLKSSKILILRDKTLFSIIMEMVRWNKSSSSNLDTNLLNLSLWLKWLLNLS